MKSLYDNYSIKEIIAFKIKCKFCLSKFNKYDTLDCFYKTESGYIKNQWEL